MTWLYLYNAWTHLACPKESNASCAHLSQIMVYHSKHDEREDGSTTENPPVLCSVSQVVASARRHRRSHDPNSRSSLHPSNRLSTQTQRLSDSTQPSFSPAQDLPLFHQVVQHGLSLHQVVIDSVLRLLDERMFVQSVIRPRITPACS